MPRPRRARPVAREASPVAAAEASITDQQNEGTEERRTSRRTRSMGTGSAQTEGKAARATGRARDEALGQPASADVTATATARLGAGDDDSGSSVEVGRREISTPARRRDTTGLDLADDDVFGDLDDSFDDGDVPRAPMSTDTTLSMSNFKSRSRQSSFIGRNDPPIRPSSRRGSTSGVGSSFNIGMFRRRAREPSILGTSRKPRPEPSSRAQSAEAESDEEDFAPDAESTPLDKRRRTGQSVAQAEEAGSSTRKRKSRGAIDADEDERSAKMTRVERGNDSEQASDSESELSSLSASPQLPPVGGMLQRPVTPVDPEAVAAPPISSDSEDEGDVWPDIHTLAKRRRRPSVTTPIRGGDARSDISSPPSLTHSPNFAETRRGRSRARGTTHRQPSPKVTTADLTGLLPKRRHRRAEGSPGAESDDEIDNTGLGQDDDELSYLDTRAARRRRGSRATSARPGSRGGRSTGSALKPKQTPASSRSKTQAQTYSRRSSDKENESGEGEEDDSGFQPGQDDSFGHEGDDDRKAKVADQLKEVVKKFNEVDQWELEFEEVVESASSDGAR